MKAGHCRSKTTVNERAFLHAVDLCSTVSRKRIEANLVSRHEQNSTTSPSKKHYFSRKKTCMACRKLKLRIVFQAKQENCITSTKHSRQDLKCPTWHACSHRERSNLKAVIVEKSEFQCSRNGFEGIRGDSRDSRTRKKGLHQCFWSKQVQFWETAPKISLQTPFEGDGQLAFANTVVHLRPQSRPFLASI